MAQMMTTTLVVQRQSTSAMGPTVTMITEERGSTEDTARLVTMITEERDSTDDTALVRILACTFTIRAYTDTT